MQQTSICEYYGEGDKSGQCNLEKYMEEEVNFMDIAKEMAHSQAPIHPIV